MSKREKSLDKLRLFQGFTQCYIVLVLWGLFVMACSNKIFRHHFSLDKSDVFMSMWSTLNFFLCVYFLGKWLPHIQRRFYKVLVFMGTMIVFLLGYVIGFFIVMFFESHTFKLEVVNTLYNRQPDIITVGYLTCENLKTKQMARIEIQKDYSKDFPEPETYNLAVNGKSYPAVLNIRSILEFTVTKDSDKSIDFVTRDHTCALYAGDKPIIEGFFSFDRDKDSEREERQFYAAEYEKKHPPVRTDKTADLDNSVSKIEKVEKLK